jgi:hypothetical protein
MTVWRGPLHTLSVPPETPDEENTLCPRCGQMTRTVVGLCPNCGGVKVAGAMPAEERYRPGLLFDSDDFDPIGWFFSLRGLGGALLVVVVIAGIAAAVLLI